ncbi:uracil-xanthine permease family protein [Mariniplasma anaerobium]|uniref:Uracil permease n=1 Tax=Mariniplasma anaerobium TaxID=2735436 RepID=A0A7U9TI98_9MOLU|nr:solute carrier family 23 protein [Mariniplasma anaerobium]BCR35384.1 uracil permease [Mariniplasma anaerobium]
MEKNGLVVGINEKPTPVGRWIILSLQHVFAMFGATVLVPMLTGLDVGVALVASGLGTLIYILCTKGKVPVYLGSSFAYITTISAAIASTGGVSSAYVGLMVVGIVYAVIATIIYFAGSNWLRKLLPPIVIGPMIIIIGLTLAPVAVKNFGLLGMQPLYDNGLYIDLYGAGWKVPLIAFVTFATVVILSIKAKGFLKIVPFVIAIFVGYIASIFLGAVDLKAAFTGVSFFQLPNFQILGTYKLNFSQILVFAPLALVTISEHIGDHIVLGEITGNDFIKDPGLHRTLLGDGIATFVSASLGGPANTTYGENTGVIALTKVGSVYVVGLAAIFAVLLGFFGYIQAFIMSIPWAVIGGMTIILYGLIAANGVKVLIKAKTDLSNMKNLIVVSTMLVIGLGGAFVSFNSQTTLAGMSLAALVGIILNQVLTYLEK